MGVEWTGHQGSMSRLMDATENVDLGLCVWGFGAR